MNYLGIDVGTTGIKGLVVEENGQILDRFNFPLTVNIVKPGWSEQNPMDWWKGVLEILKKAAKYKINSIGLSGQMHSLVTLDKDGKVVRPAILWNDQRTTKECQEATQILGGERNVISEVGNPILEGFTLGKILWIKKNEPENFKKIRYIMMPKDYIAYMLTGKIGTEWSDASGTAFYDVRSRKWNSRVLKTLEINEELLPSISKSYDLRGFLEKSKEFGWENVKVVAGGADNAVSALGIGVFRPGDCMVSVGTSGTVLGVTSSKDPDSEGKLHYFNHVVDNFSYYMGVMLSATSSFDWARRIVASDDSLEKIEEMVKGSKPGSNGLIFLPYLNGERTPHRDPHARGVIFGISLISQKSDILRSVIEGITFGLRDSFELVKKRVDVKSAKITGGGSNNLEWVRIIASNFKVPVEIPEINEGGAYGAAMLAAVGDGKDFDEVSKWIKIKKTIEPEKSWTEFYDSWYYEYKGLYNDLKERFKETDHQS
ncbi:xylulokinase [Athalassotoga saccharophila]|uniref:xylulokinase n=1 Tax=Athalassotoga saccharophila TaxID=1441386 RepID=UPI00137A20A2|nr:xylulokinase [Athalassotoga saccharophila]BBJ27301.1 xylulose kinase [Athalassotoga saccharophila]